MKRFIIKLVTFAILLAAVDTTSGFVFDYMVKNAKGGVFKQHNYINNELTSDIIFLGSSRCMHHYVTQMIEDSLGLSCYNCGMDGMGIPFMYARYKMIAERCKPKYVFYDVCDSYDLIIDPSAPNTRNLKWLKPFYNQADNSQVFSDLDSNSKYKMQSKLYRWNSNFFRLLQESLKSNYAFDKGYVPLYGELSEDYRVSNNQGSVEVDSFKINYWRKFIETLKMDNVQLVLLCSPTWGNRSDKTYNAIFEIAKEYDITVLNHSTDPRFVFNREYFVESWHLNDKGAHAYTSCVISEIKDLIN